MTRIITRSALSSAITKWLGAGWRVGAPKRQTKTLIQYDWLAEADEAVLDGFVRPANSIKAFFLPRTERLFAYQGQGRQVELVPTPPPTQPCVVLAARPCDAAALPALDQVFNWDFRDPFYNQRRELTTVVSLACRQHDRHCFCTSVGVAPDSVQGADALLVQIDDDTFEVRCVTDKGQTLWERVTAESKLVGTVTPGPDVQFDLQQVQQHLAVGIDDSQWQAMTLSCLGCGACAHSCPTCHCFDIVDQLTAGGGCRVRNWDTCQASHYSQHASGHNPRPQQIARQRNRNTHKYQIYLEKFGALLCTGCGNCSRNCTAGLGVLSVLKQIDSPMSEVAVDAEELVTKDSV